MTGQMLAGEVGLQLRITYGGKQLGHRAPKPQMCIRDRYADLHVSYIVLLEKGSNRATIETLDKLAKAFGISISDLVQSLDEARDDPVQKQLREVLEDFVQKIDAIYKQ